MDDQLPAEMDVDGDYPKQAKQLFGKLAMVVNGYCGDRARLRGLVLFEERENGKAPPRPMSKLLANDLPQTELILHHRNQIRRLDSTISGMHTFLTDKITQKSVDGLLSCMEELTKWERLRLKHLEMLESLVEQWTDQVADKETMMAKLAADNAHLSQKMAEHKDKMELANKVAAIPTTTELKQRLALKYGVPVEQVEAILAAKQVEAETADG